MTYGHLYHYPALQALRHTASACVQKAIASERKSETAPLRRCVLAMALTVSLSAAPSTFAQSAEAAPSATVSAQDPDAADPAQLIDQGRYAEAFPLLERRVMLHPDDVNAWIEYAHVVDALGRNDEARAVRNFIAHELGVDDQIRMRLAALDERLAPSSLSAHQWRGEVSLLTGHESNANTGPSVREVTFSVPGELPFTLALNQQSLPRASSSHLLEARLETSHPLSADAELSTSFDWRQRNTPEAADAGSRQWQADAALSFGVTRSENSARQWLVSASLLDYDYGGSSLFRRQRLAVGVDQRVGLSSSMPCRIQGTLEHEWRHYPAQDGLVSHLDAIQAAALCTRGTHRWLMLLRFGKDRPQESRPGGIQWRQDFSVGYRLDMSRWGQIDLQAAYSGSRDSEVYNELFGHARRRIARTQLFLSYVSPPFLGRWQALARAEFFHQRSNISLFQMRGRSVHFGLRYSF